MRLLRSLLSVFVTYALVYVIIMLGQYAIAFFSHGTYIAGHLPPALWIVWFNTAVYAIATIIAGWLCILWAPAYPRQHLLALFILGEIAGLYYAILGWQTHPHWLALLELAIWPAGLWYGGIHKTRSSIPTTPSL